MLELTDVQENSWYIKPFTATRSFVMGGYLHSVRLLALDMLQY